MIVLGIESSCDDTSIAIVNDKKQILSMKSASQIKDHLRYGGVVPEIASRKHYQVIRGLIEMAVEEAKIDLSDLDAIAVTSGPGLVGGLLVGIMVAKGMAFALKKPIIPINHLEGHALTIRLTSDVEYPYLLISMSGGHTQILSVKGLGEYEVVSKTIDDACGEAFDKVAKMLGLGFPGGPEIEKLAKLGDENAVLLPKPLINQDDFSFSGLKTAVSRVVGQFKKEDVAASFQKTVGDILVAKLQRFSHLHKDIVVAGGVAANQYIKQRLMNALNSNNYLHTPPISLCTDNGAMIAWVGMERLISGKYQSGFDFEPKSRWPIEKLNEIGL